MGRGGLREVGREPGRGRWGGRRGREGKGEGLEGRIEGEGALLGYGVCNLLFYYRV